ncbi:Hypothetical predicted protein [Prunus dulcis]|uniref:PREDICTED: reverse mRNAase n=1 Tax=Prunus dulcis TaxID=3755 RepID=A0A5E4FDU0_PRUDU|nr:hypothetical protein L3X38_002565 [Prunus dulcis]VVA26314.1 PREDICTED: reverse mRNAase [Prunus dulcis]VVA26317.1 Hypothetical predicted protein [Prunus dulcis]
MEVGMTTPDQLAVQMGTSLGLQELRTGVTLFGSLIADKPPNIGVVKRMLRSAWAAFGNVQIVDVKDLIFSIKLDNEEAARKIVDGGPWTIMGFAFCVQYWPLTLALEELNPSLISYWVQAHGVPRGQMNGETAGLIGAQFERLIGFEDPDQPGGMRGYFRSRVELNALNPLPLGIWLLRPDQTQSWVEFLYERLANFCFQCGRLGHGLDHCKFESVVDDEDGLRHYGSWMKARISRDLDVSPPIQLPVESRRRAVATRRTVDAPIASGVHVPPERVNRCEHGVLHIETPDIIPAFPPSDVRRGTSARSLSIVPNGEGPVARLGSNGGASGSRPIFSADAGVRQWIDQGLFIPEPHDSVFVGPKCWNLPLGSMAGFQAHTLCNSEVFRSAPCCFVSTPKIQTARMLGEIQLSEPLPIHHTPVVSEPGSPLPIFQSKRPLYICSPPVEPIRKKPKIATQPFQLAMSTGGHNLSPKIRRGRRGRSRSVRNRFLQSMDLCDDMFSEVRVPSVDRDDLSLDNIDVELIPSLESGGFSGGGGWPSTATSSP